MVFIRFRNCRKDVFLTTYTISDKLKTEEIKKKKST
jgi:hypothetical protein